MATRNRAHSLAGAIESARAQRFTNWELIIVDDGSTDDTKAVVARFTDDARIRYERQAARGAARARNHGLSLARGAFIAYLDSDNLFFPDFIGAAVDALTSDPGADIVYGALVSEHHGLKDTRVLWEPFSRTKLLQKNFIDLNTVMHRRELFERLGGLDESLPRLQDWDLMLRYTASTPAKPLPVLAARYGVADEARITLLHPGGPSFLTVRRKWDIPPAAARQPRVLYALWHYPQLSESYIETEIRCMCRWGVHVEVWSETGVASPYPTSLPIHRGTLAEAIDQARPDIVHIHWLSFALQQRKALDAFGLPVTIRVHGFEFTPGALERALQWKQVRAIYGFPHHVRASPIDDSRLRGIPSAFDTELFKPHSEKDRSLVVRTSACLPSKDLPLFFALAKQLPNHRFVLAVVTCKDREAYVDELREEWRKAETPAELRFDMPRDEIASLVGRAGIYLHTARLQGEQHATPIGGPISIAEAMATGAYILVRDAPPFVNYVGDAGTTYRDVNHAAEIIQATETWSDGQWRQAWHHSVDRAFTRHADELALRPIIEDWIAIVNETPRCTDALGSVKVAQY
jgi:glycosyltransferase involved in cell wall biosynthesis